MPRLDAEGRRRRAALTDATLAEIGAPVVLTRQELTVLGWTDEAVAERVASGGWQRLHRGVVLPGPGPADFRTKVHAAWVASGPGAVVAGRAAAALLGITDSVPEVVEIHVPHGRTPARRAGVLVRHVRLHRETRPFDGVRVTDIEDTVLDLVSRARSDTEAVQWVEAACGRRLSTPDLLLARLKRRKRFRRRRLLIALCQRVRAGEMSPLERWATDRVLVAHGLPPGLRQVRRRIAGRTTFSDIEIAEYGLVIELDGRLGHEHRWRRDMARDNAHAEEGRTVLRYGWHDSVGSPCAVAAQIGKVLTTRGWPGVLGRCGPRCAVAERHAA